MNKLSLNTLREEYLNFFESKGHLRLKSFPLIPQDDPSILLINAGMTPLKPYFTGTIEPPSKRITSCQKCIRTLDIDRVGITTRHGTFFEMLGNFSFGDYFKLEAIQWSWEFLTKVLNLPENLLYASVYEEDDEAYEIWKDVVKLPVDHIVKLGKEDNFWEHGTGPCGPSSEIYFDRGSDKGCGSVNCKVGCDCDRFVEVWNNVFTQFDKLEDGTYKPLKNKNIDTGMGLERLACVVQGVDSLFEVDTIKQILDSVCDATKTKYGKDKNKDVSIRVITDHVRSAVMMISDGIIPSNEGRGYVLRRLLRRASRHGRILGNNNQFLADLTEVVINNSKDAYPELSHQQEYIFKVIESEENKFVNTIESGMNILNEYLEQAQKANQDVLEGEFIFKLHDTYGFPYDLTREIANERGFRLDKEGFDQAMQVQKTTAREAFKAAEGSAWKNDSGIYKDLDKTEFLGYSDSVTTATVLDVFSDSDNYELVTDKTVFYAEGGGQRADTGYIRKNDAVLNVLSCVNKEGIYIHKGTLEKGNFSKGDTVCCEINKDSRRATERNHTATHMLQYALKEVLGNHVHQAGSYVDPFRLRFDFTHFSSMTDEQIDNVQKIVNKMILDDILVNKEIMSIEEAKKKGATALFGEKYGNIVRVVSINPYSMELCGGTHLDRTGQAGLFKILSESACASGIRRIEAVTGEVAFDYLISKEKTILRLSEALKTIDLETKIDSIVKELKQTKKENDDLKNKLSSSEVKDVLGTYEQVNDTKIIKAIIDNADMSQLRNLADRVKDRYNDAAAVFIGKSDKPSMVIAVTKKACEKGISANKIIKEAAAYIAGSGGGREDMAQAGGKDSSNAEKALQKAVDMIKEVLNNG